MTDIGSDDDDAWSQALVPGGDCPLYLQRCEQAAPEKVAGSVLQAAATRTLPTGTGGTELAQCAVLMVNGAVVRAFDVADAGSDAAPHCLELSGKEEHALARASLTKHRRKSNIAAWCEAAVKTPAGQTPAPAEKLTFGPSRGISHRCATHWQKTSRRPGKTPRRPGKMPAPRATAPGTGAMSVTFHYTSAAKVAELVRLAGQLPADAG